MRSQAFPCATSANLGPGFDTLGLALEFRDSYTLEVTTSDIDVRIEGEGEDDLPRDETHLVVRAIRDTLEAVGAPQVGIRLTCRNVIPHGRGLGSSAAAIVGGIALARGVIDEPQVLDDQAMLEIATSIEGHPDNVAPAILGGATLAYMDAGAPRAHRLTLAQHEAGAGISPIIVSPLRPVSTAVARGLLSPEVPRADATFNVARSALLVHALMSDPSLLLAATADRLHQDVRSEVMPQSIELIRMLRQESHPAVLSGAGPTVLVLNGDARTIAARVSSMVDEPDQWRIAQVPVAESGIAAVLG